MVRGILRNSTRAWTGYFLFHRTIPSKSGRRIIPHSHALQTNLSTRLSHLVDLHLIAFQFYGAVETGFLPGKQFGGGAVIGALHLAGILFGVHRQDHRLLWALPHHDPLLVPQGKILKVAVS